MTEIFNTDIRNKVQAYIILSALKKSNPELKVNYDLNETNLSFPCGHTILRVEANNINSGKIAAVIIGMRFNCEILQDKVCV